MTTIAALRRTSRRSSARARAGACAKGRTASAARAAEGAIATSTERAGAGRCGPIPRIATSGTGLSLTRGMAARGIGCRRAARPASGRVAFAAGARASAGAKDRNQRRQSQSFRRCLSRQVMIQ